jgi:hypothetical protein
LFSGSLVTNIQSCPNQPNVAQILADKAVVSLLSKTEEINHTIVMAIALTSQISFFFLRCIFGLKKEKRRTSRQ